MLSRFVGVSIIIAALLPRHGWAEEDRLRIGGETLDRTVQLRTHSIFAPYIDQDLQNRWWDFGADAYVNTNKHIRLTQNRPSQTGYLWSRLPLTADNFVIEVEFKISGDSSHIYGDGLAIWLTQERVQQGPIFGNRDKFNGLGIFLDTYANAHHGYAFPRVNAMLGDGETSYDMGNDGDAQSAGGCSANFRRTNVATKLKITKVKDKFIDVKLQYKAWDDWADCFHIKNFTLPAITFLGFTAMTGDVSDAHDIIAVATHSALIVQKPPPVMKKKGIFSRPTEAEAQGTWLGFFFKLFLFAGVCAGGYYGYQEYRRKQAYGGGNFGMGRDGFGGGGMYSRNKRTF